jgi:hypothetical protein
MAPLVADWSRVILDPARPYLHALLGARRVRPGVPA